MSNSSSMRIMDHARDVIDLLAAHGPLSHAEIAQLSTIPRSSVYRLVDGLQEIGLVVLTTSSLITLANTWLHLADSARAAAHEWDGFKEVLTGLTRRTGRTSFLFIRKGWDAFCLDWSRGRGIESLALRPGRSFPLYQGGGGRSILAYLSEEEREEYLTRAPFEAVTKRTLVTAKSLREDILLTRRKGYALSDEDVTLGIGALGIPIFAANKNSAVAALSFGGIIDDILVNTQELVFELVQAVSALPQGFSTSAPLLSITG